MLRAIYAAQSVTYHESCETALLFGSRYILLGFISAYQAVRVVGCEASGNTAEGWVATTPSDVTVTLVDADG